MVQIKSSVVFILAAAAISTFALPVPSNHDGCKPEDRSKDHCSHSASARFDRFFFFYQCVDANPSLYIVLLVQALKPRGLSCKVTVTRIRNSLSLARSLLIISHQIQPHHTTWNTSLGNHPHTHWEAWRPSRVQGGDRLPGRRQGPELDRRLKL